MKRFLSSIFVLALVLSACKEYNLQDYRSGIIQGHVFFDENNNSIWDNEEIGRNGVLVELLNLAQNPREYTTREGFFSFPADPNDLGVPIGIEEVLVTPPVGMRITTGNARTRVNVFENTATDLVIGVGKSLDVGSITGLVFQDSNANGTQDAGEPGIANAIVELTSRVGTTTAHTNTNGVYKADGVLSGDVTVQLRESCGLKASTSTTRTSRVFLGGVSTVQAFGETPIKARVSGRVFHDFNNNGVADSGELSLPGWTVYADINQNARYDLGEPAALTCSNGNYALDVPDDNFKLRHVMNLGFGSSQAVKTMATTTVKPLVVGGQPAIEGSYPFMVALVNPNASNPRAGLFCGGTLIAPDWVLTAAHCLFDGQDEQGNNVYLEPSKVDLVFGTNRLENPVTRIQVAQIIAHPDYNRSTSDNDLALLRLSSSSNLPTVQPLIPMQSNLSRVGVNATVVGWGDLTNSNRVFPIDLHEAVVPISDQTQCNAAYFDPKVPDSEITTRMICAGYPQGGIDGCQGDSGGPLLIPGGIPGLWLQTGIVSFGNACALPNYPGVYTRVSEFSAFLEAQIGRGLAGEHDISLLAGQTREGVSFAVR